MAISIVLGAAFGKIVSSFVKDILMPPIGMLLGGVDFSQLFLVLEGGEFATLAREAAHRDSGPDEGWIVEASQIGA